nr:NADH-quinone oxidoreductase subunit C [Mycolicibacterium fluoranthenivorans]
MSPDRTSPGMFGVMGSGDTSGYGRLTRTPARPAGSPRPYGGYFDQLIDTLAGAVGSETFGTAVERVTVHRGQLTITVARKHIREIAEVLRDHPSLRFELCAGVSGVHFPAETGTQLHAMYPLMSITHNHRICLEVTASEDDPHIPSLYTIYPTCDWHERETYDFFGIVFDGHPALTRIQMPDDWVGHPQRKDHPLGGIPVQYHGVKVPPPDQRRAYH